MLSNNLVSSPEKLLWVCGYFHVDCLHHQWWKFSRQLHYKNYIAYPKTKYWRQIPNWRKRGDDKWRLNQPLPTQKVKLKTISKPIFINPKWNNQLKYQIRNYVIKLTSLMSAHIKGQEMELSCTRWKNLCTLKTIDIDKENMYTQSIHCWPWTKQKPLFPTGPLTEVWTGD